MLKSIDLFSGCGGLTEGLKEASIDVAYAVEIEKKMAQIYTVNHPEVHMINEDISTIEDNFFLELRDKVNFVAGCPPCQGFTQLNRNNEKVGYMDERNELILEFYRVIKLIQPEFIMMENVPQVKNYENFLFVVENLKKMGYKIDYQIVEVHKFGVPQRRKRLVMMGSKSFKVEIPLFSDAVETTVRDYLYDLEKVEITKDEAHKVYSRHSDRILEMIKLIPKNGGSRKDLPVEYWLDCHKKDGVGFTDVYGRMGWDRLSPTITGGCLSPSKGRFLHPEENRSITLREAALLQTFPKKYKFDTSLSKGILAQMIGNAIPPKLVKFHGEYLKSLL
ncbi:DNA (cytosine-5-)-methyltransferase [Candidatus Enterococcus ikei]|uniref:DNA (cytosine-5-)-methyltransferase n=1 Tax=Candidatus Enterococcus ikei TaxID=2815326 RepID=A0ABS3GWN9_9ENTE|nr:DNA cytosine methyltransferase [Enterococcus sp. DIV0869a]